MVWSEISLGYRIDLHIFKRGSVTAVRYRDEALEHKVRLTRPQLTLILF